MVTEGKKLSNRGIMCHVGNRSDEWYTKEKDVEKVLPYVAAHMERRGVGRGGRILCPFDCADSAFVKVLTRAGYNVDYGDLIHDNKDFFTSWNHAEYDLIISNPPFSIWLDIMRFLLKIDVPFCMLTRYEGLLCGRANYLAVERHQNTMSLLMVSGRLSFGRPDGTSDQTPLYIAWIANNFTPEQCVFLD